MVEAIIGFVCFFDKCYLACLFCCKNGVCNIGY